MTFGLPIAIVVMLVVAFGVYSYANLLRLIRWKHRSIHEELGRPRFLASPDQLIRLQKFVFSRRAVEIADLELNSTVKTVRILTIVLLLGLMIGVTVVALRAAGVV